MKLLLVPAVALIAACSLVPGSKNEAERYFLTEVKPVLQQHCLRCHNGSLPPPLPNFSSKAKAFTRSAAGRAYIVPYEPAKSLLVTAVQRGGTHTKMMPRTDVSLTDMQIGMLREWIEMGAAWPTGAGGALRAEKSGENP